MKAQTLHERPPAFTYQRSRGLLRATEWNLLAEGISVSALARKYGTPLYVYSRTMIEQRFREFDNAFGRVAHTVCYSVKANSNLSILKMLAKLGAGFDVVSGGELQRALAADRKVGGKIVFSGVGKQGDEIDLALRTGILLFNVESASELQLLAARAAHLKKRASFAVRVNPDVAAETHPYISTGLHEHKFGVPLENAAELYRSVKSSYLQGAGVSVHIGSQINDLQPFSETMEKVAGLVVALRADGHEIRYVDAGGGLGIGYRPGEQRDFAQDVKAYAAAVGAPLKKLGIHLLLEPGRSIVAPAGILITRVVYKKRNHSKVFLVADAAMNDMARPSLYNAYHEIIPVTLGNDDALVEKVDIVGPICESADFLGRDRELPSVDEGALLAVLDAGAYGMSLSSNYNTRPRAAEVLVDGRKARLVRRRETISDLLGPERF